MDLFWCTLVQLGSFQLTRDWNSKAEMLETSTSCLFPFTRSCEWSLTWRRVNTPWGHRRFRPRLALCYASELSSHVDAVRELANVWGGGFPEKSRLGELLAERPVQFVGDGRNAHVACFSAHVSAQNKRRQNRRRSSMAAFLGVKGCQASCAVSNCGLRKVLLGYQLWHKLNWRDEKTGSLFFPLLWRAGKLLWCHPRGSLTCITP